MAINLVKEKTKCSGCSACMNICPVHAISMTEDENGFLYPSISSALCIECKQCVKACPFKKEVCPESLQETYAAVAQNVKLSESSSGAVFPSVATNFIKTGGVVYGCSMQYENDTILIKHIRINDDKELNKLKGSKYVQSDIGFIYQSALKDLNKGIKVLFTGTPCQIAGLYGYLGKDFSNLYTIDIVCHGVPSQKFFRSYIQYEEVLRKIQIRSFVFRDKTDGWKLHGHMKGIDAKGHSVKIPFNAEESSYYQLFLDKYTYRDSCYKCPYASKHRPANITAADYWNIDLVHPELVKEAGGPIDVVNGVSALVINNEKGRELIDLYGKNLSRWTSSYENASKYNRQFSVCSTEPLGREALFEDYKLGYETIDKKYKSRLLKKKIKRKVRAMIPMKRLIKVIMKKYHINRT